MKILLTGAAGGIGSTLGHYLFSKGHELTLVDNLRNGYEKNLLIAGKPFGTFYNHDICDPDLVNALRNPYDCIIHFAAVTSLPDAECNVYDAININVAGTANIIDCARKWDVPHVIFASTVALYDGNTEEIFTEDLITSPRLWYSASKKMAEEVCASFRINYGLPISILRFFNVFGPRQDLYRKNPFLLNYLVREIKNGNQPVLHSDGTQSRDFIHVDDVVRLVDICLRLKPDDTFNVCTGIPVSVNQVARYVAEALNSPIKPTYREANRLWDTYPDLFSGRHQLNRHIVSEETNRCSRGSFQKAKEELGWEPNTDLEALFKQTAVEIDL